MMGETISHYKILEKLGEGGMGVVFKAIDMTLGRPVALKFVLFDNLTNKEMKQRLIREAKACASLNHPNISTIYEFVEEDEKSFIAMEYIEGKTLQALLEQKRFEVDKVLEIALQAVDALDVAHKKGIIHRDLKSANIMLDVHDRVKIMDFGLAKLSRGSLLTQTGATLGTAAYMSPEQAKGEEIDSHSDIYSMGVILYELLTGELPFKELHPLAVMYSVVNEEPIPPRELNAAIPPELEAVILKAMEKEPKKRYENFEEMRNDLLEFQGTPGSQIAKKQHDRQRTFGQIREKYRTLIKKVLPLFKVKTGLKYLLPGAIIIAVLVGLLFKNVFLRKDTRDGSKREIAKTHVELAMSYLEENNYDSANKELDMALKSDSTYSLAWSSLAALNYNLDRLDIAILQTLKAIEFDPQNRFAAYNLAFALEDKKYFDLAIEWYGKAIEMDSTFTQAYSALGNLYNKLNRPIDAILVLNNAKRITPESNVIFLVYKNLGRAYFLLDQYNEATRFLELSQKLNPNYAETIQFLAEVYEVKGMPIKSIEYWQQYIEIESDTLKRREALKHLQNMTK